MLRPFAPAARAGVALVALRAACALGTGQCLAIPPQQEQGQSESTGPDLAEAGALFVDAIDRLRSGDERAVTEVAELAQVLASDYRRPDAMRIAKHYLGLTPEQRTTGLARRAQFESLRERANAASRWTGEQLDRWPAERAALMRELDDLSDLTAAEPDYPPAAHAQALAARLALARAERDPSLGSEAQAVLLEEVEERALHALTLFDRAGQITPQLDPLWVLADLARVQGRHQLARERYADLEALSLAVDRSSHLVLAHLGRLQLAREEGDPIGVERQLGALARITTPSACWPLAREHATSLYHADRPEAALGFLQAYRPSAVPELREWHALSAACLLRSGDRDGARSQLEALDGEGRAQESDPAADSELARAALDLAEKRPAAARQRIYTLAGQSLSPAARAQAAALEGEAWLQEGRPQAAREALIRALQLADDWRARLVGGSGSIDGEWLGLNAVVLAARAHAECGDPLEAARLLEQHQGRTLRDTERVRADDLLTLAGSAEAGLITYGIGADESIAVHVDAQGTAHSASIPTGRRALSGAVRRLREACHDEDPERIAELATELSRMLLPPPIADRLMGAAEGGRLIVLAHGGVESLPLTLLPLGSGLLDERLALTVLPGVLGSVPAPPFDPAAQPWAFLGAPGDPALAPLPHAQAELIDLAARYPGALLAVGAASTGERLLRALGEGRAVHVATHLVADPRCDDLRLAGEALAMTAGERLCAAQLALRPNGPPVPLAVLTACSSGGGRFLDGEGLFGVARALLETGTERLAVTLWPVRDASARRFSEAFHSALMGGQDPAKAAQTARQALRQGGLPARDWAAFRILGWP